jgi:hypothetical protein
MTKATLTRAAFNWGWVTGSEVQSILINARAWHIQAGMEQEDVSDLHLHLKAAGRRLAPTGLEGDSGTLPLTRSHLRVPLPEPGIFKPPHFTHESKGAIPSHNIIKKIYPVQLPKSS